MKGFFVRFWGTRGSIPTPGWQTRKFGGNTSCVEVRVDDVLLVCDGGTGLRSLGLELMARAHGPVEVHLFFSHPHWDHIQGFPFFAPAYAADSVVYIYGREAGDTRYYDLLSGQMQSDYFPVSFSELSAHIRSAHLEVGSGRIGEVSVSTFAQVHPGGSLAYKFTAGGRSVVYSTDNELDLVISNRQASDADPALLRQVQPAFIDFIRGVDLLIADGQYRDDEYATKHGWGHPRATTVVDAAVQAGVKRLAITHHDPMHGDQVIDELMEHCALRASRHGSSLEVFGAREQVVLRVDDPPRERED